MGSHPDGTPECRWLRRLRSNRLETEVPRARTGVRYHGRVDFQGTLFDEAPAADVGLPALGPERTLLSRGAWVDVQRNWLPGADVVFEALVRHVPWRAERRQMYDRVVDVPRLVHT